MEKTNRIRQVRGGCGILCKGRYPYATAELRGSCDYPSARGRFALYATPTGVVVSAELRGLPAGAVLRLCLKREGETCVSATCFPLLYERNGEAWFTDLTERISPWERSGGEIALTVTDAREEKGTVVARGTLRSSRERCG